MKMNLNLFFFTNCSSALADLAKAIDCFYTSGWNGILNASQQIDRMANREEDVIPCITPRGLFWSMEKMRPVTGSLACSGIIPWQCQYSTLPGMEKMILMGFPVDKLLLGHLEEQDWFKKTHTIIISVLKINS